MLKLRDSGCVPFLPVVPIIYLLLDIYGHLLLGYAW